MNDQKITISLRKNKGMPQSKKLHYTFDEKFTDDGKPLYKSVLINAQARKKLEALNLDLKRFIGEIVLLMKEVGFTRAYVFIKDDEITIRFKIHSFYWIEPAKIF